MRSRHVARSPGAAATTGVSVSTFTSTTPCHGGLPDAGTSGTSAAALGWVCTSAESSDVGRTSAPVYTATTKSAGASRLGERVASRRRPIVAAASACGGVPGNGRRPRTAAPSAPANGTNCAGRRVEHAARAPNSDACGSQVDVEVDDVGGDDVDEPSPPATCPAASPSACRRRARRWRTRSARAGRRPTAPRACSDPSLSSTVAPATGWPLGAAHDAADDRRARHHAGVDAR